MFRAIPGLEKKNNAMKRIEVAAAIIRRGDRIFATQRGYGEFKDWWEFPGGKIEPGETPEEALKREIREELDAAIEIGELLQTVEWDYPAFHLTMHCFWCGLKGEALHLNEHEAAAWLSADELDTVRWLPADRDILVEIGKVLRSALTIRKSAPDDIPEMMEIFAAARRFMARTGNPGQWSEDYPGEELLKSDIASGDSHVILSGGRIVATFVLRPGNDPTYDTIYDGNWPDDLPYATIHRIASRGERKGMLHAAMQYALERYSAIRIDTHRDNTVMRNAIAKEGFKYCGIIHCWNGTERLAYQFTKS